MNNLLVQQLSLFPELQKTKKENNCSIIVPATKNKRLIYLPKNEFSMDLCEHSDFITEWQMPKIQAVSISAPMDIFAFYRFKKHVPANVWGHCYTTDKRLIPFITNPYRMVERLKIYDAVIGLDLSIKPTMPLPIKIGVSFYNKLITAFWQRKGLTVIPNICWCDESSYDYCFAGYPKNSVIAINSTGIGSNKRAQYLWEQGYMTAIERLSPTLIIRYGAKQSCEKTEISKYFDNDNKKAATYGSKWFIR